MKSNKNNKKKRVKFLGLIFTVLTVGGWLSSATYVGKQTEKQVRSILSELDASNAQASSFHLELLEYNRSLLNASFDIRLRATDKEIDSVINGLVFRTDVKHGPLVFNQHNLQLATASFHSYLDQSQLDTQLEEVVTRLFDNTPPFNAQLVVDYDLHKHYQLDSNPFKYEAAGVAVKVSSGSMKGIITSDSKELPIQFELDEIVFKHGEESLTSLRNQLIFNLLDNTRNQLTASAVLSDNAKYTGMSVNLKNLQLKELLELVGRYENRHSIDQQIEWTLEEAAQYQEGQDRLIALFQEQENQTLPEADLLVSQLFKQGEKDISFSQTLENIELVYNNKQ